MSFCCFILAQDGTPLMPITNPKRFRKLLKSQEVKITGHDPLTAQLQRESGKNVQPVEMCIDAGEIHIGISIKSEKQEFVHELRDLLVDEKKNHDSQRRIRRARRNRKRYRKPRFDNRSKNNKKMAPSIRNKEEQHVRLARKYCAVVPIEHITIEVGSFDTQVLEATEAGKPVPKGLDYQHGPRYGYDTLREAVFARDQYTCIICGSTIGKRKQKDGTFKSADVILRMHHLGFKEGDRSNRMSNLATVCTRCHTAKNHKPGGKLYDLKPKLKTFKGAAFMNQVKNQVLFDLKAIAPNIRISKTYGAVTKRERLSRNIEKTHANDAYCMGTFHPKKRSSEKKYKKQRRNDRKLQKFYDAKFIDVRDGSEKEGSSLSRGRTNRKESRRSPKNNRIYRGKKLEKGHVAIRRQRSKLKPGSIVEYNNEHLIVHGTHAHHNKKGMSVNVEFTKPASNGKKSTDMNNVKIVQEAFISAWQKIS